MIDVPILKLYFSNKYVKFNIVPMNGYQINFQSNLIQCNKAMYVHHQKNSYVCTPQILSALMSMTPIIMLTISFKDFNFKFDCPSWLCNLNNLYNETKVYYWKKMHFDYLDGKYYY